MNHQLEIDSCPVAGSCPQTGKVLEHLRQVHRAALLRDDTTGAAKRWYQIRDIALKNKSS
ncbi:MAG: hypothetical protein ACPG7F_00560 [Aggregatilineales bacterium]